VIDCTGKTILLNQVNLETSSYCNRRCVNCIRNSHHDKYVTKPWLEENFMPMETIRHVLEQVVEMGHPDSICLQFYNEPLLDPRIADIAAYVKSLGLKVSLLSNGDNLTEELASRLDGVLDMVAFTLYQTGKERGARRRRICGLFEKTFVKFKTGVFIPAHYAQSWDLDALVEKHVVRPCNMPTCALYINFKGEVCLCCADFGANFDLGTVYDATLREIWYGEKHQQMVRDLLVPGGRKKYPFCSTCPRRYMSRHEKRIRTSPVD